MDSVNKKVLIIEDEELMSKILEERFSKEGYQVLVAEDGEAGLAMALEKQPDIILLDIIMPKLDGISLMDKLRAASDWGKHVPIILLTNLSADDNISEAIAKDKPADYLVKTNWSLDEIASKVKTKLGS